MEVIVIVEGDVVEIGGFNNYFKERYTRGRWLNLDRLPAEGIVRAYRSRHAVLNLPALSSGLDILSVGSMYAERSALGNANHLHPQEEGGYKANSGATFGDIGVDEQQWRQGTQGLRPARRRSVNEVLRYRYDTSSLPSTLANPSNCGWPR